ncbi:response regulator transcription factor [Salinicoccus sesuvii]|uniref:Response regulator transcription factor n=1 Tax=Salinicoccus sesuvii TaxID=868281 RepID=A0ABV7N1Y7_9STAP
MATAIEMIEKFQQTFATQYGLTFFLTDGRGEIVTSIEGDNSLCRAMLDREELLIEISNILKNDERINRPLICEVGSGIHIMVSPVAEGDGVQYYLWAGVLVEAGMEHQCQPEESDTVPVLHEADREEWLDLVDRMAELASLCLRHEVEDPLSGFCIERFRKYIHENKDASVEMFSQMTGKDGEIDFMGIAEQTAEDTYTVSKVIGEGAEVLKDQCFLIGEGFLGRAALMEERSYWEDIGEDRRARFFSSMERPPQFLFIDVVKMGDGSVSVIFGGSLTKKKASHATKILMQMVATLVESSLLVEGLRQENKQQLSRLTSLVELSSLMASTPDSRRMVLILLDISINLVEGPFSLVLIKDEKDGKGRLFTRGNYVGDVDAYVGSIMERTDRLSRMSESRNEPHIEVLPSGERVIECPLLYGIELMGILSVGISNVREAELREHIAFLQTLSIIGGVSLQLAGHKEASIVEEKTEALHLAVAELDQNSYDKSKEAAELAAIITTRLEVPQNTARSIVWACQLSYYSHAFISRMFPEQDIAGIMEAGNLCAKRESLGKEHQHGVAGYIYALCTADSTDNMEHLECVDEQVLQVFLSLTRSVYVSEITFDIPKKNKVDEGVAIADVVSGLDHLSPREQEVLTLLSKGKNNQEIAETLYISTHTVKNHVTKIFHKLDVSDRVSAISKVYSQLHK